MYLNERMVWEDVKLRSDMMLVMVLTITAYICLVLQKLSTLLAPAMSIEVECGYSD